MLNCSLFALINTIYKMRFNFKKKKKLSKYLYNVLSQELTTINVC